MVEFTGQCRKYGRFRFDAWVGKMPWRKKWQRFPVLLSRKFYGQRILVAYSPWCHREVDTTKQLSTHTHRSYRQVLPRHKTWSEYAKERCGKLLFAGYLLHAKRCAKHFIYASACFDKSLEYSCKVSVMSPFYSEEGIKAEKIDDSH